MKQTKPTAGMTVIYTFVIMIHGKAFRTNHLSTLKHCRVFLAIITIPLVRTSSIISSILQKSDSSLWMPMGALLTCYSVCHLLPRWRGA